MDRGFLINHRKRVWILSVLLILIPICIMGYILLYEQLQEESQAELTKNMQITEIAAHSVDEFIEMNKVTLQNLASMESVKQEHRPEITQILYNFDLAHPEPSLYWVAKADGSLVAKYPDDYLDQSISDRDFFKESMQGKTFTGGPYIGRVTGYEIIVISEPYYRDNKIAGVVGMSIPLSELQKRLAAIKVGQSGYASLLTQDGQVLSHPNLEEFRKSYSFKASPLYQKLKVLGATSGSFDDSPNETDRKMHSFVTLKEAPWVVVIAQPLSEFNRKVIQTLSRNIVVIILLVLLLALLIHYLLLLRDISNAEKNKQTEKLAMVGELAAGVAHEIRNPLTAIKGFIQLIGEKKGEIPDFYIETIQEELNRIEQIVGGMVVLAKPALETKNDVDLSQVLQDTVNLMGPQARLQEVELSLKLEPGLPPMYGVRNQLKQVFINLIKNAIEAMENGGTVIIQASHKADKLLISVEDTGKGIPKDMLDQLGTPFFTTKEEGTGLGLTVTYRIIQNHKGEVYVQSKVGVGTQFKITFPSHKKG